MTSRVCITFASKPPLGIQLTKLPALSCQPGQRAILLSTTLQPTQSRLVPSNAARPLPAKVVAVWLRWLSLLMAPLAREWC